MLKCVEIEPVWPRQDRLKYLQRSTSFSKSNSFRLQKCVSRGEQELAVRSVRVSRSRREVCDFFFLPSRTFFLWWQQPQKNSTAKKNKTNGQQPARVPFGRAHPSSQGEEKIERLLPVWKVWFGAFLFRFVVIVLGVCGTE